MYSDFTKGHAVADVMDISIKLRKRIRLIRKIRIPFTVMRIPKHV